MLGRQTPPFAFLAVARPGRKAGERWGQFLFDMANVVSITLRALDQTKAGFMGPIKNLKDLGNALEKVRPAYMALAATATAAFGMMAKSSINQADELGKLAQGAGVTVEAFSAMNYAAGLSNISGEEL